MSRVSAKLSPSCSPVGKITESLGGLFQGFHPFAEREPHNRVPPFRDTEEA